MNQNQSKLICELADITIKLIQILKDVELSEEQRRAVEDAERKLGGED